MPLIEKRKMNKSHKAILQDNRKVRIDKQKAESLMRMKRVREGESPQTWERRVRKHNLMKESAIQKVLESNKFKIYFCRLKKKTAEETLKDNRDRIKLQLFEKQHDYLSYFGIVKNYYCTKYRIGKTDFDICLAFYNNKLVSVDHFYNICILNHGSANGFLRRFVQNGYIVEILHNTMSKNLKKRYNKTGVYKLSVSMIKIIHNFYLILSRENQLKRDGYRTMYPRETEVVFEKMNAEINDYLTMNKVQPNINEEKEL